MVGPRIVCWERCHVHVYVLVRKRISSFVTLPIGIIAYSTTCSSISRQPTRRWPLLPPDQHFAQQGLRFSYRLCLSLHRVYNCIEFSLVLAHTPPLTILLFLFISWSSSISRHWLDDPSPGGSLLALSFFLVVYLDLPQAPSFAPKLCASPRCRLRRWEYCILVYLSLDRTGGHTHKPLSRLASSRVCSRLMPLTTKLFLYCHG